MNRNLLVALGLLSLLAVGHPAHAQTGACCLPDGSCADLPFFECATQGGQWLGGPMSSCATFVCPSLPKDWGDAPDPTYPTLDVSDGAVHTIDFGFSLGGLIDEEDDGQPNADATGDDLDGSDDEDGITFTSALVPGSNATITVVASAAGKLDAWIDFNKSGGWEHPQEHLFSGTSLNLAAGTTANISFAVPAGAVLDETFARFRFSSAGSLMPTGAADDGEVEDYQVTLGELDWGDADDPTFATLAASDGARHIIRATPRLGSLADGELDGQPNAGSTGDDLAGLDDEDGLIALSPLRPGQAATMDVAATGTGMLDGWIDYDVSGTWDHPAEHIFGGTSVSLVAGTNAGLTINVPATAFPAGNTLRLRVSSAGGLTPAGLALDGEVEDHAVDIEGLDWGDAPDPAYATLKSSNGAWHIIDLGYRLGIFVDHEPDAQPNGDATGDDLAGFNDEDGVRFLSAVIQGLPATIEVTGGPSNSYLDAWIDLDQDGVWEASEHLNGGTSVALSSFLTTNLIYQVPITATPGTTYARFRVSAAGGLGPTGFAPIGEVEDHQLVIKGLDWGDAPDSPYPTLATSDGARHLPDGGIYFGASLDTELQGLEGLDALGDDLDNADDEDGVEFTTPMIPGQTSLVSVTVGPTGGVVDAWIDFDQSGSWGIGERVFGPAGLALTPGTHGGINLYVPPGIPPGPTYARFRISSGGGLSPTGFASDGEVEDYKVTIEELDWGDAPDPSYPTLRASGGAHHVVVSAVRLGTLIDGEPDGQQHPTAQGDDLAGTADEDGVSFAGLLVPGQTGCVDVIAGPAGGQLDAWIDFDGNGAWEHPAEHLFGSSLAVSPGLNAGLCFAVPAGAAAGQTAARFRISSGGALAPNGIATDGEVEDYLTEVVLLDWGDAPDPTFATRAVNNGPAHILRTGYRLGALIDSEADGQPVPAAQGDDLNGANDEDGIVFAGPLVRGTVNCLTVEAGAAGGVLNAWIDYDADGVFDHPAERLFSGAGHVLSPGVNSNVCFTVPWDAVFGTTFARFRLSGNGGLTPTGQAPEGEVEDYGGLVVLQPRPVEAVVLTDITGLPGGGVVVSWNAESNILYQLQLTTNLLEQPMPAWSDIGVPVLGPLNQQTDPGTSSGERIYRVLVPSVP